MGDQTIYLKLTVSDGKIVRAERIHEDKKAWVPATPVQDLREKSIRRLHGMAISQNSPDCILLPVWTDSGIAYVEICPTTVSVSLSFP